MSSLQEIFQLEWWLENNFSSVLNPACPDKTFRARDPKIANDNGTYATPRIETLCTVQGLAKTGLHSYVNAQKQTIYDAWQGELQTSIVSNRIVSEAVTPVPLHYGLIAGVRALLYQFRFAGMGQLIPEWNNQIVSLVDIRETGSDNSFDGENNIDRTTIKWFILFQVNPNAWNK